MSGGTRHPTIKKETYLMQTLFEAANHIAQEIERTRQHLTNLEQALEGLRPLMTVDAAPTTVMYTLSSQAQPVEDLSVVNTVPAKKKAKSTLTAQPKTATTKSAKTRGSKAKAVEVAAVVLEPVEPVGLPATGAKLWLKCIGRKKVTVAQLAEAATKKLKLDDSARDVMTSRAKAWTYMAAKKGDIVTVGTRDGSKLYQLAPAKEQSPAPSMQPVEPVVAVEVEPAAPAGEAA